MSLVRNSLLSAAASLLGSLSRFALLGILARRLSPTDLGRFAYAMWLVDMAFLLFGLGVNACAGRYLAEHSHEPARKAAFLRAWIPWAVLLPVLAGFGALAGARFSGLPLGTADAACLGLWAAANGWWNMQSSALVGYQEFGLQLKGNAVYAGLTICAAMFLPHSSPAPLFLLMAVGALAASCFGVVLHTRFLRDADSGSAPSFPWRKVRTFAINLWLTGLLGGLVWSRGELPIVRAFLGDAGVADYTVALTLFFGTMQAIMIWAGGIAPHLTALWSQRRHEEALGTARMFADLQLLATGAVALLLVCLGPGAISLVFGRAYHGNAVSLDILLLGLVALSASAQNHLLQLETDGTFNRNLSLAGLAVLYATAFASIPRLGVGGAALSRMLTMLFMLFLSHASVRKTWGGSALSGRNVMLAWFAVLPPVLLQASGHPGFAGRAAMGALGFAILVLFLRTATGRRVSVEATRMGWLYLGRGRGA